MNLLTTCIAIGHFFYLTIFYLPEFKYFLLISNELSNDWVSNLSLSFP